MTPPLSVFKITLHMQLLHPWDVPIRLNYFVANICIDSSVIVLCLPDHQANFELVSRSYRNAVREEFTVKFLIKDWRGNTYPTSPKFPFPVAPYQERLHNLQIAILLYDTLISVIVDCWPNLLECVPWSYDFR